MFWLLDKGWQELYRDACVGNDVEKQWEIFSGRYYEAEKLYFPVKRVENLNWVEKMFKSTDAIDPQSFQNIWTKHW